MSAEGFFALADGLNAALAADEVLFTGVGEEQSDFVRLSQGRVRQAGSVASAGLGLTLIAGERQVEGECPLAGDPERDLAQALALLAQLRERLPHVPDDPYLSYSSEPAESCHVLPATLPTTTEAIATLLDLADGLDLVGIWASGRIAEGLASSIGHRHWHEGTSFNLDWSCYAGRDKAVKASLGGFHWQPEVLAARLAGQREALAVMARPERRIEPGRYRAYLAPAAFSEIIDLLGWGGFGLKDHRTRQSPLLALARGEVRLSPRVSITEEHGRGLLPRFTGEGFLTPAAVPLIDAGRFGTCLTDARSAKEYGEPVNAAAESPASIAVAAGDLPTDEVLARLGTGLYIGNLWYGNWSDRNACRMTGMTRFGSFWVEEGRLAAPLAVMRFDDSLYHLLGDRLEAITRERELMLAADTYDGRSTDSALLPGVLVSGIELAL